MAVFLSPVLSVLRKLVRTTTRPPRRRLAALAVRPRVPAPVRAGVPTPPKATTRRGAPDAFTTGTFSYRKASHTYKLYLPPSTDARVPPALVVMLHGCNQNPDDFAAGTGMNALARQYNLVVLYPAQSASANAHRCWNWFEPDQQRRGLGEPAWIAALTRATVRDHGIDPKRVFIAGLSAGGAMAATVAESYPELFAACGVHSGLAAGSARGVIGALSSMRTGSRRMPPDGPARHVPTIVFHGDADTTVHPLHGEHLVSAALASTRPHGRSTTTDPAPTVTAGRSARGSRYARHLHADAKGRILAERWQLHDLGHAWSGGSRLGSYTAPDGPDASAEMLRFFLQPRG